MRIELDGGYAVLLDVSQLHAGHQDQYFDLRDELVEKKRASLPEPGLDPQNPAVRLPAPEVLLNRRDVRPLYDLVATLVVQECPFPGVLPWNPESRQRMPLPAWNKLRAVLDDIYVDALLGTPPKEKTETAPT